MNNPTRGKVYLVGAGPGDPGLLTLKGKAILERAEVVVYDALVSPGILGLANPQAVLIDAGKRRGYHSRPQTETTKILLQEARAGNLVVRLKGGDPFIFGRGGEEMADLVQAGIPVEVVPGVTAGIAAPAAARIPLTHREHSSLVTFVTGHESQGKYQPQIPWRSLAEGGGTIVIYMGLHNLPQIVEELQAVGMVPSTPIGLVGWGTMPNQRELVGTLATIIDQVRSAQFEAPAIIVIGAVVSLREILQGQDS